MKRALIVAGPESSGTHLVTDILCELGGVTEEMRRWDAWLPTEEELAVIRWSFPHAKRWPDIVHTRQTLSLRGYQVRQIITMRDQNALIKSQIAHHHVGSEREARRNIGEAYRRLFGNLVDYPILVAYDSLVRRPRAFVAWLAEELRLQGDVTFKITDETAKHYKDDG